MTWEIHGSIKITNEAAERNVAVLVVVGRTCMCAFRSYLEHVQVGLQPFYILITVTWSNIVLALLEACTFE